MIEQPIDRSGRQHDLRYGEGVGAVADGMESDLHSGGLADVFVQTLDGFEVIGGAGLRRNNPILGALRKLATLGKPMRKGGSGPVGHEEIQRLVAHGVIDAGGHGRPFDPGPDGGDLFGNRMPDSRLKRKAARATGLRTGVSNPLFQHGGTSDGSGIQWRRAKTRSDCAGVRSRGMVCGRLH